MSDNPQDPEPIRSNCLNESPARKFSDFSNSFAAPAAGCGVGGNLARISGSSGREEAPTGPWEGSWECLMAPPERGGKLAGTPTLFSSQWFVVLELTVPTMR